MKEIYNIFPKETKFLKDGRVKIPKQKITIDYREKNSLVVSELVSLGFEFEFKELKVADYIIRDVAIERKTVSDFITSMKNRRLSKQLEELQQYENRLLIVEGIDEQELYTDSEDWIGMHPNAIRGFLLSILLKHKVPIIFTKNYEDTAKFIAVLAKRKNNNEMPLNVKKKTLSKKEQLQFIIEGFPGIGPKTAKKLLSKFKTIKNIINASEEELREVCGKKTEVLKNLFETYYKK